MATPDPPLPAVARELYGLDPGAFIPERDARARAAKSAGDAALARAITALRKPTQAAWLTNLLVRTRPDAFEDLLRLGEGFRQAERQMAAEELRPLLVQRRAIVGSLVKAARRAAAAAGRPVAEDTAWDVETTLELALADAAVAEMLRSGTLVGVARRETADPSDVRSALSQAANASGNEDPTAGVGTRTHNLRPVRGPGQEGARDTSASRAAASSAVPEPSSTEVDELARRREQRRHRAAQQARAHRELMAQALARAEANLAATDADQAGAGMVEARELERLTAAAERVSEAETRLTEVREALETRRQAVEDARWARMAAESAASQARDAVAAARQRLQDALTAEQAVSGDLEDE